MQSTIIHLKIKAMIRYDYAGNFKPKPKTEKQLKELKEREEFLRKNQNGKFGSIY